MAETKQKTYPTNNDKPLDNSHSPEYIYMKQNYEKKIYKIPKTAAMHSKMLLTNIINNTHNTDKYGLTETCPVIIQKTDVDILQFIYDYMMYNNNRKEKEAPEAPLKKIHISSILGNEYELFINIYNEDDLLECKIEKINKYIKTALYFDFKYLCKKLCALAANLIINSDINQLQKICDKFTE